MVRRVRDRCNGSIVRRDSRATIQSRGQPMVATRVTTIIDGDGHVMEDQNDIARFIPAPFAAMYRRGGVFPPLDHLHLATGQLPPAWWRSANGDSRQVGPSDWVEFRDDLELKATVLYPTAGLAYGRIVN